MTERTNQIGGDHYAKLAIDPFTFAMANRWDPMMHSILKYLTRYPHKGTPAQDLRKAAHIARYRCEFPQIMEGAIVMFDLLNDYIVRNQIRGSQRDLFLLLNAVEVSMRYRVLVWPAHLRSFATACEQEACKYE